MKNKISLMLVCLFTLIFVLSGCNLFPRDDYLYLTQTVATVDGIEISKEELILYVNNYGASYMQQGMTADEAVEKCLDNVIMQKLLIREAETLIAEGKIELTVKEKNDIWRSTFEALNQNLKTFEDAYKKEQGPVTTPPAETEKGDSTYVYVPYEPQANVVWDNTKKEYVIQKIKTEDDKVETELIGKQDFALTSLNSLEVQKEGMRRYIRQLKTNETGRKDENGKKLSTIDVEVWDREIDRVYKNVKNSKLISKVLEYQGVEYDVTPKEILEVYMQMVRDSYIDYMEDSSAFLTSLSENAGGVNYVPPEEETYFYVAHILIQYSSAQLEQINGWKSQLIAGNITEEVYNSRVEGLKQLVRATERADDGSIKSTNKTVEQVLIALNEEMARASSPEQRADVFNTFMYRYGQDPGILNSENLYTVGEKTSGMMESFTEEARRLHKLGVENSYTDELANIAYAERWNEEGTSMDYGGFHILFYAGEVKNTFNFANYANMRLENSDLKILAETRINALQNKTFFDLIYETANSDRSSAIFEDVYIKKLMGDAVITRFKDTYKDLKG